MQTPSGHPPPSRNTPWQKQPVTPAAHMQGLTGTSEPHAPPAHMADAPVPKKGYCSAVCQHRFPRLHQTLQPFSSSCLGCWGDKGTPSPCACAAGGLISPRPHSLRDLVTPGSLHRDRQGGEGDSLLSLMEKRDSAPQPQVPAEPIRAMGQTQPCCPAPPGTSPRAPSLHQLP